MLRRNPRGARTDRLKRVSDNRWEMPAVGMEYYSPWQHGGIYGTVYRQYFATTLPSELVLEPSVSKLIDYTIFTHNGTNRYGNRGWSDNGSSKTEIKHAEISGYSNLVLSATGAFAGNIIDGWVEYTK